MATIHNAKDELNRVAQAIRRQYGLDIVGIVELKTVYGMVATDGHQYIWKFIRTQKAEEHIHHIMPMLDLLSAKGVSHAGPIRSRDGSAITDVEDGRTGVLQPWVLGQHVDYRQERERLQALSVVALMHRQTRSLATADIQALPGGPLLNKLAQKRKALYQIWPQAVRTYNELQQIEQMVFEGCELACTAMNQSSVIWSPNALTFCHRDLAPHNLMISQDRQRISLIDFDLSGFDDPFLDVMQVTNHYVFTGEMTHGDFLKQTRHYLSINPTSTERAEGLWALIRFPDVILRVLLEWGKTGFRATHATRIRAAVQREQRRHSIWTADYAMWSREGL